MQGPHKYQKCLRTRAGVLSPGGRGGGGRASRNSVGTVPHTTQEDSDQNSNCKKMISNKYEKTLMNSFRIHLAVFN